VEIPFPMKPNEWTCRTSGGEGGVLSVESWTAFLDVRLSIIDSCSHEQRVKARLTPPSGRGCGRRRRG
jgi:hypothetical protein